MKKYKITYEHNSDADLPCCARTTLNKREIISIGASWTQARNRLITKIESMNTVGAPPPSEEVEL
jgi:hypothetical protein